MGLKPTFLPHTVLVKVDLLTAATMSRYVRIMKTGPVQPLVEKFRFIRRAKPELYGGSMLKNAMDKLPQIVFICVPYLIAMVTAVSWQFYINNRTDYFTNRPYKAIYTVMCLMMRGSGTSRQTTTNG